MHASSEVKNNLNSRHLLLGVTFVVLGSSSYGMLSTFVKLAYRQNYSTAEVTSAQFFWGLVFLSILSFVFDRKSVGVTTRDAKALMTGGISVGLTSVLYYAAVQYIAASIAVVLLMQSVWIGVVVEALQTRRVPSKLKIASVGLVLLGTALATNLLNAAAGTLDVRGLVFGFLAALSFSATMYATNSVATHLPPIKRSLFMLCGGSAVVALFAFFTQIGPHYLGLSLLPREFVALKPFDFQIFLTYGLVVAIFGTVIPQIMLNRGFPITGVGLGSILSAIELPFAIVIAFLFLGEVINVTQWAGVAMILGAIILMNYRLIAFNQESDSRAKPA